MVAAPPPPPHLIIMPDGVFELCPVWAPLLGFLGAAFSLIFSSIGSAWGTGKAGQAISSIGVKKPEVSNVFMLVWPHAEHIIPTQ